MKHNKVQIVCTHHYKNVSATAGAAGTVDHIDRSNITAIKIDCYYFMIHNLITETNIALESMALYMRISIICVVK